MAASGRTKANKGGLKWDSPLSEVKGVGAKTAELFARKNLWTAGDMLSFYPRGYTFYDRPVMAAEAVPGSVCALKLVIVGSGTTFHARGKSVTYFRAADESGQVRLTFFNMPFLKKTIQAGTIHVVRGLLKQSGNGNRFMEQPRLFTPSDYESLEGTMQPRYSLTAGLKNSQILRAMERIHSADKLPVEEFIPEDDLERLDLAGEEEAYRKIHFPSSDEEAQRARKRLVFDEFLLFLLQLAGEKERNRKALNPDPMIEVADTGRLIEALPYRLTGAQARAWKEIEKDLSGEHVMNRLLQGDVGSGKTIIAFLALLMTAANGRQGALMAPTEVLAAQHMQSLSGLAKKYGLPVRPVLLTGSVKGEARRTALKEIEDGTANVIIGTHALIQEGVNYRRLGLVVTDEQHRFGVRQREALAGKGYEVPILVMSATPIPRTLAIILYGDLDVSLITELPGNRRPIRNTVVGTDYREKAWRFIARQVGEGRQAFIICPAIEEGQEEDGSLENVTDYTEKLREGLPAAIRVDSLTGRMKPAEKERVMADFAAGRIDVLVSTTVIEVGINVPNATVMMVENAERFGLAQLHQLRGRVGRGGEQSYCIFMTGENVNGKPERLAILEKSNDGFYIAEQDLKLRGPGELGGIRQSGELGFVLADIYGDAGVLRTASEYVRFLEENDPELALPGHSRLRDVLSARRAKLIDFRTI